MSEQHFHLGNETLKVPRKLHALNRERLCEKLRAKQSFEQQSFVVLQGGETETLHSSDKEISFRQESYFHWLFGVKEPDCYGAVDVKNAKAILFIPRLPESYSVWMGKIHPKEHFQELYAVDEVYYTDEIAEIFKTKNASLLLTLSGVNTDSKKTTKKANFDRIQNFVVDEKLLFPEITECRVFKTPLEIDVLRYVTKISSDAHKEIMLHIRPGMREYQLESLFEHYVYAKGGCRHVAYCCIAATGNNCSTLHYGHAGAPNDKAVNDGDMCLFDMGGEYYCYTSDITCSYPCNGKFTEQQKGIYNAVLKSSLAVMEACKPGVNWVEMHLLADRVHLEELRKLGVVCGDIDEMMAVRLGALFMPHGLGHMMGLDVHDVGGYLPGQERRKEDGLCSLRTVRNLQANMVLTVEPGIYFIEEVIRKALTDENKSKFIVKGKIEEYYGFGGVRIEDDVLITEKGCECLSQVPRTVKEIEEHMAAGKQVKINVLL